MRRHLTVRRPVALPRGFTLAEMLIVVVLFGLVVGGLMTVIRQQQAFYRSTGQMMEVRSQADQAFDILPRDLRALSSVGGDITEISDSAITFRAQLGSSVVCSWTGSTFVVPPSSRLMKRHRLTVWRETPDVGDEILVYDDGVEPSEADDVWRTYTIASRASGTVNTANACAPSTGLVVAADTANSWRFTVAETVSPTIVQGAPIRFGRTATYALYQAADGQWYLGYEEFAGGAWTSRSPVSGPHRAYSATAGASGLDFVYLDASGTELDPSVPANLPLVARIDVTVRGMTKNDVNMPGKKREQFVDSLYASVNLRNRQ